MKTFEPIMEIPLALREDGTICVKNTRLPIDAIVGAYNRGERAESIFETYSADVSLLSDIFSIISYYLNNKTMIDDYLAKRQSKFD